MTPSYQRWEVRGYMRPVTEWDSHGVPFSVESEPVVVVADPRGWEWHVTADDGGLTSLTIHVQQGQHVGRDALQTVPLGYLSEVAQTYQDSVEAALAEGYRLEDALAEAERGPGQVRVKGDPPTPEAFAEQWKAVPVAEIRDGRRTPQRQLLADHYGVSKEAVDKWTRAARDAGLIPPATTGKKRQPRKNTGEAISPDRKKK